MASIERAVQIAAKAHEGQKDKDGKPYLLHPLRVMGRVDNDEARIAAVLHDVVEDTDVTLEELRKAGFSEDVLTPVDCLTHAKGVSYMDYVVRCRNNAIARQVKLADLEDNARLERALMRSGRLQDDMRRMVRYVLAYQFLTNRINEAEYRERMKEAGV